LADFMVSLNMAEKSEGKAPRDASAEASRDNQSKPEEASAEVNIEKFLVFAIRDERYALPSGIIGEVAVLEKVFPLPLVPDYVRGMINRYSIPYALVDISLFLRKDASDAQKVIVLKEEIEKIAFLIDDVIDIAELPSSKLIRIEKESDGFNPSINACFESKGNNVLCLDTEELIGNIQKDFDMEVWK